MKIDCLYNTILLKARNFKLYKYCKIKDNLQNKIILLLIYFAFIFNKLKKGNFNLNQKIFDYFFLKIEMDLRELGFGDMYVNKKMKLIVNKFYSILINFDDYHHKKDEQKYQLIEKLIHFETNNLKNLFKLIKFFDDFVKKIDLIPLNDIYESKF